MKAPGLKTGFLKEKWPLVSVGSLLILGSEKWKRSQCNCMWHSCEEPVFGVRAVRLFTSPRPVFKLHNCFPISRYCVVLPFFIYWKYFGCVFHSFLNVASQSHFGSSNNLRITKKLVSFIIKFGIFPAMCFFHLECLQKFMFSIVPGCPGWVRTLLVILCLFNVRGFSCSFQAVLQENALPNYSFMAFF